MKKFKRLLLSLCVICLTLFILPSTVNAAEVTFNPYLVGTDNSITELPQTTLNRNVYVSFSHGVSLFVIDIKNISVEVGHKYSVYFSFATAPTISINSAQFAFSNNKYVNGTVDSSGRIYFDTTYIDTSASSCTIRLNVTDISGSGTFYFTPYGFSLTDNGTIDSTINGGFDNLNTGISNIQSSISTINSDIVAINSNITGVNNSLILFERNVEEDMSELRTTISSGSSDIVDSIGTLESSFLESISFVNQGIADAWKTSQSIEQLVKQLMEKVDLTNTYIETWFGELFQWFELLYDWQDLIVQSLVNVQSQSITNTNDLINALSGHDMALAINISNLGNSLLNGMNVLNTDIQNQMIAQTSNITNNIISQTNALNSSIKTMESSVTSKLDDTLVIKDKSGVDSNDSSTEELESAITDYDNVEKDLVTDFNESLDSIDIDSASSIYSQNDFVKTAQFISTNMQNVYDSNDFVGGMIDVSLLLGLIFTIIGIGVR